MEINIKIPLYIQIYNHLKERILSGAYQNNEFLPSERELGEQYHVERATVRRSLELLVKDGLVVKIPGAGSRVKAPASDGQRLRAEANNIAFILPGDSPDKITQPFISSVFYCFEEECKKRGYHLFYTNLMPDDSLPNIVLQNDVKGIVWVSCIAPDLIRQAKERGIPSVLVSNSDPDSLSILCDNVGGSEQVVEHLVQLGRRQIAYIGGIQSYRNAAERRDGFLRGLASAGIPADPALLLDGAWTFDSGFACMQELLRRAHGFTAVYAANDMMAFGALKALTGAGLSVPDDVSLAGFDDIEQCRHMTPALTTVGVDPALFARQIIHSLLERIGAEELPPARIILPARLHIRESTSALKNRQEA